MATAKSTIKRKEISYFDGLNTLVANNLSKKQELPYVENARCKTIGTIEKREGTRRLGDIITATANFGIFQFDNTGVTNTGFYRISTVSAGTNIYYLNTSAAWTVLGGSGAGLNAPATSAANPRPIVFSTTIAESCCFIVNVVNANRYISSDGSSVVTSSTASGHLYGSPIANKINLYKDRLYLGDYTATTRYKTGIMMSSEPVGIVSLIDGDFAASVLGDSTTQFDITNPSGSTMRYTYDTTGTDPEISSNINDEDIIVINAQNFNAANNGTFTVIAVNTNYFEVNNSSGVAEDDKTIGTGSIGITTIKVTDTKYIHSSDTLDIYRGGTKIAVLTVSAKTEDTITATIAYESGHIKLLSADELWVSGTYTGTKIFRWADNPASGENVKQYDTFKISGSQNDRIKMLTNVGDVQMIANNNNIARWNNANLKNFDLGVGCVSDNGYIKTPKGLWFLSYKGIYWINDESPPILKSAKVQRYFDGATTANLEAGAMGLKGESIFCAIGDVTLYHPDGSVNKTVSDVVLEYDMRKENWYVHSGIKATQFCTYISSGNPDRLECSTTETKYPIWEFLIHNLDDYSGAGEEIYFRVDTHNITLADKNFEKICYPLEIIFEVERGHNIHTFVSLDNGAFYELEGVAKKGCTIVKVTNKNKDVNKPPRCRQIRISPRDFSKSLCKISKMAIIYAETEEEENYYPDKNA